MQSQTNARIRAGHYATLFSQGAEPAAPASAPRRSPARAAGALIAASLRAEARRWRAQVRARSAT